MLRMNLAQHIVRPLQRLLHTYSAASGRLPIPPPELVTLVAGSDDVAWFLQGGMLASESITEILDKNGIAAENFKAVLDFGCGCGRVIRHLKSRINADLYGTDYNPRLIEWCRRNLTFGKFATNDLEPPVRYEEATFDFVYALSVFTHMPKSMQMRWMEELERVLKPGGHLLITTHGDYYLSILTHEEQERYHAGELVVRNQADGGTNNCAAFHPAAYVRKTLSARFTVVDFIAEGAKGNPRQDEFLLRKQ